MATRLADQSRPIIWKSQSYKFDPPTLGGGGVHQAKKISFLKKRSPKSLRRNDLRPRHPPAPGLSAW